MNKLNSIFKKVAELEKNANEVKLGMHEVELASTFNQAVDKFKFLEKTINEAMTQFNDVKKWVQASKQDVDKNSEDLTRIQKSLIDLGFKSEADELSKYVSSNIFKDYIKLFNATK